MEKEVETNFFFAESNFYKNGLALVNLCKREPNMLEDIKKYLSKKENSGISDDLSNVTSIKLISLMDEKEIISLESFDMLLQIFYEINPRYKEELSRIRKCFLCYYAIKSFPGAGLL